MRCNSVRRKMHLFYYRELPDKQQEAIQIHLRHCPGCASEYARLETMMHELTQSVMEPGTAAGEATWQRIVTGLSKPRPDSRRPHLVRLAAAVMVFAVGLGTGLWLSRRLSSPTLPPPEVAASQSEWSQYLGDLELLLLDAGNSRLPVPTAAASGERAVSIDRLLFQNRYLKQDSLMSPEAQNLLEETALLLQEIRNRSASFQRDPGWLQKIIAERHMIERIHLLLSQSSDNSPLEVERAPVI